MEMSPLADAIGMVVGDVQLGELTTDEAAAVDAAWNEHGLLVFRDQELDEAGHLRLAGQLGEIDVNRFFAAVEGFEEIADVRKEVGDELNIGGGWHTDHSYDAEPARGSILVARDVPPVGGQTRFLSTERAWATLPDDLKERVGDLDAVHSSEQIFGPNSGYAKRMGDRFSNATAVNTNTHPAVIEHPISGRPCLYVNPAFTTGFVGMEADESKALLDTLLVHIAKREHAVELTWEAGMVAMWDNRSTWHWALNNYEGHRRQMHRITLAGVSLGRARHSQPA